MRTDSVHCRYLREPDVLRRVPFAKATLHRLCREGNFPKPVKIGPRAVAWLVEELDAWDAAVVAARDTARETA